MINLIVGHRGTGKTHWLKIVEKLYKEKGEKIYCFDLDEEIKKQTGKSIDNLFLKGEKFFRDLEQKAFETIIKKINPKDNIYIVLGAGCKFKKQKDWNVIFLSRLTDKEGRVFLDRPLLSHKNPLEDYKSVYLEREKYYTEQSNEVFYRLEYFKEEQFSDKLFLGLEKGSEDLFCLQLNPKNIPKEEKLLKSFLNKRMNWGIRFFEIHDEIANEDFIHKVMKVIPKNKILFSSQSSLLFCNIPNKINWSWDLSLGEPPQGVSILTLHQRKEKDLKSLLADFSLYKNHHLKLSIEIFNLKELEECYKWQQERPHQRNFLPRSLDGRWRWFRNAFGSKMFLNFIREGESSVLDQPFFSEAVHFSKFKKYLGAVIGYPIDFSATPQEHNSFFYQERSIPLFPIPLKEGELKKENLEILKNFGFVFFAVTSPLKKEAFLCADYLEEKVKDLERANTLIFHNQQWKAYNTDIEGLKVLKKRLTSCSVGVWGGGGVRPALKAIFPSAVFYSARTGKIVFGKKKKVIDVLIWAVGRKRMKNCLWPPKDWTVHEIIDLNYVEDSPGREYALKNQIKYQSGYSIFKEQAKKQREIFLELDKQ